MTPEPYTTTSLALDIAAKAKREQQQTDEWEQAARDYDRRRNDQPTFGGDDTREKGKA
jgi:hypothetical protein